MTYTAVCEDFLAVFNRRVGGAGPGGLFDLQWVGLPPGQDECRMIRVISAGRQPDCALAPTREALAFLVPESDDASLTVYGTGQRVAFLWELTSGAVLEVRELAPRHMVQGAIELALSWVW